MATFKVSARTPVLAPVLVVVSALIGVATTAATYAFLVEYGPTTGSRVDGVLAALEMGALPLLIIAALAAIAFRFGRRALAVVVVALSLCGVVVAGAQAAVVKYDRLAKVPDCVTGEQAESPAPPIVVQALTTMEHPGPFGPSRSSTASCSGDLLNVTFTEAAKHYRERLPAAGWVITTDSPSEFSATRGELTFVLDGRCDAIAVEVRVTQSQPRTC